MVYIRPRARGWQMPWWRSFLDFEVGDFGESDDEGFPRSDRIKLFRDAVGKGIPWEEWRLRLRQQDLVGKLFLETMIGARTPLGNFVRQFSDPERLPQDAESTPTGEQATCGRDVLPLHPAALVPGLHGVTETNIFWVKTIVCVLNYLYCAGWSSPVCVSQSHGRLVPLRLQLFCGSQGKLTGSSLPPLRFAMFQRPSKN